MEKSHDKHIAKFGVMRTVIDRIDNNGHYSKENCRWVTPSENNLNSSRACANKICEKCELFKPYRDKGIGWRAIAKATGIPSSTVIYHTQGHPDYHTRIKRLTQTPI